MVIRSACQQDATLLAKLIYASGAQAIDSIFSLNPHYNSQGFLLSALRHAEGQYGFANHWLAIENEQVLGSICAWHTELSADFRQATLHSVVEYFGLEHSFEVVARSQLIERLLPPPQAHEWCIGHLAVEPQYRRQGVASYLLDFMAELALQHGKTMLSLDVSTDNHSAIEFYLQQGFNRQRSAELTNEIQNLDFVAYLHMFKKLV